MFNWQADTEEPGDNRFEGYFACLKMAGLYHPTMVTRFLFVSVAALFLLFAYGCAPQCEVDVLVEPRITASFIWSLTRGFCSD